MADWYVSSIAYAAIPVWQASTAYTVGQIVRGPVTPATSPGYTYFVQRCTTSGTSGASEPGWSTANNGTTNSGTAVFTNVSGQAAYGWSAAAGNLYTFTNSGFNRPAVGDRIFLSSDHVETISGSQLYSFSSGYGSVQVLSVNRAGSVPPVAADLQRGAAITAGGNLTLDASCMVYWEGVDFTSQTGNITFNNSYYKTVYIKDCKLILLGSSSVRISCNNPAKSIWDNCQVQFSHVDQRIHCSYVWELTWLNTADAFLGSVIPTTLFLGGQGLSVTCRGVNISDFGGILFANTLYSTKFLLDHCHINPAMTRLTVSTGNTGATEVELIGCYDGTDTLTERTTEAGVVSTDRATAFVGGAEDEIGIFSFRFNTSAYSDRYAMPLDCFWFDVFNAAVGAPLTATVEVIASVTLTNHDIQLQVEYMGTAGSPLTSFSFVRSTGLATPANLPTSSGSWIGSPGTPVKQKLQVTFTPAVAGRVRGRVSLGKPSTTVWINPQLTLS